MGASLGNKGSRVVTRMSFIVIKCNNLSTAIVFSFMMFWRGGTPEDRSVFRPPVPDLVQLPTEEQR
jgi:hypothetical protein